MSRHLASLAFVSAVVVAVAVADAVVVAGTVVVVDVAGMVNSSSSKREMSGTASIPSA